MAPPFEKGVPLGGNQVRMKESDKRRFRERIGKLYPKCGEEQLAALVPSNKSVALFSAKLMLGGGGGGDNNNASGKGRDATRCSRAGRVRLYFYLFIDPVPS